MSKITDGQIKVEPQLERVSDLLAHFLGSSGDIHYDYIFYVQSTDG